MTKEKKQILTEDRNPKQPELNLPQTQLGYTLNTYIHTEKGLYMWLAPVGTTWDDSLKYLDEAKVKTKEFKKAALKKQAEEEAKELKPPAKNKVKEFKKV